jgi:succinate-semialdehyde dehydrogenase/glutarate-semialdehyde dehydrogenase
MRSAADLLRADRALRRHQAKCAVAREETFGPLAPLFRFQTEDEAIEAWPTTPSSAWPPISTPATSAAVFRVGEALEYGMVGVNTGLISTELAPFGGVKESHYGLDEFIEIKLMMLGGIQ